MCFTIKDIILNENYFDVVLLSMSNKYCKSPSPCITLDNDTSEHFDKEEFGCNGCLPFYSTVLFTIGL